MKKIIILLLAWLLLVNIFALLVLNRVNLKSDTAYKWIDSDKTAQKQSWNPLSLQARWDSFFYLDIAKNGYHLKDNDPLSNVVFFPLYPFLISIISPLVGSNLILAGWLVSIISLIGAIAVFYKLLHEFHPNINPETTIFYLLIFPTAFFLNTVYTESLFLFLSLLTFYYAFKNRFGVAGFFGLLASLTRITGVLLFIPIFYEFFRKNEVRKIFSAPFFATLFIPCGTLSFFLYHYYAFGDFFLFLKTEKAWGRAFTLNKDHFSLFSNPAIVNIVLDFSFCLFAVMIVYYIFKQKWTSYGLYIVATLGVALGTGTSMSIGRYILVLFPIYIALANIKNSNFEKIYTLGSALLFALNIILFVNWYWAG